MGIRGVIKAKKTYEEVLAYEPMKLQAMNSESMDKMISAQLMDVDFKIAEVVRNFTGLKEREAQEIENTIERRALEQLKTVEENAYKEAYALGLEEGRKESFASLTKEISDKLNVLNELILHISNMKKHFLNSNENHIMAMVYYLARRIAMTEVAEKYNEIILNVLSESIKLTHSEEKVKVHVAREQVDFLAELQKETNRDLEFLKQVELVADENIKPGGCIITTNYGEIDARIEQRIEQLWLALSELLPPSKEEYK